MKMTKVLIIGRGGREHALGWSISQDPKVDEVLYAPGNAGTQEGKCRNVPIDGTKKENFPNLTEIVEKESIDHIVVGPEQPLVDGIVDFFNTLGYTNIFGPDSKGSVIEANKLYSHILMKECKIPQADSIICFLCKE